jgi:hypothetical protein
MDIIVLCTAGEISMEKEARNTIPASNGIGLSLDVGAVIIAFLLALAVKFDIFRNVPW